MRELNRLSVENGDHLPLKEQIVRVSSAGNDLRPNN